MQWIDNVYYKLSDLLFLYCTSYFIIRTVKDRIPVGILDTDIPYFQDGLKKYDLRYLSASGKSITDSLDDSLSKIKNQIILEIYSMIDSRYKEYKVDNKASPKTLLKFAQEKGIKIIENWSRVRQVIAHAKDSTVIPVYDGSEEIMFLGQVLRKDKDTLRFLDEGFLKFFNRDIENVLVEFDCVLNNCPFEISDYEQNECESLFFDILVKDELDNIIAEKAALKTYLTPFSLGQLRIMYPQLSCVNGKLILE